MVLPQPLNNPARRKKDSDTLRCKRTDDCLCLRPVLVEPFMRCPRTDSGCICRYTWQDSHWTKGDDHARCPWHIKGRITDDEKGPSVDDV